MGRLRFDILVLLLAWAPLALAPLAGAAPGATTATTATTTALGTQRTTKTTRTTSTATAIVTATSPTDIRDLRGPLPDGGAPPFTLTYSELLAAGASALAWAGLRRRRRRRPPVAPETYGDPAEFLERCGNSYLQGELTPLLLCLRIAALLRTALARRAELSATGLTSGELLQRLTLLNLLEAGELARADRVLNFCDRVKFAGHDPDAGEAEWLLTEARTLLSPPQGAA